MNAVDLGVLAVIALSAIFAFARGFVRETLSIVDRAYLIYEGRVESEGTKDFLINDPISRQLYLGERFKM